MSEKIKIRRGLNIKLKGTPENVVDALGTPSAVAVKPSDFVGLVPKMEVKQGDEVLAGSVLFHDKYRTDIKFVSPISGEVAEIVRGAKRRILEVRIVGDKQNKFQDFGIVKADSASRDDVKKHLLNAGLWSLLRQRPFNIVPNPDAEPKSIFVSGLDTNPLGVDMDFALEGKEEFLVAGLKAISTLTTGKVHVNVAPKSVGKWSSLATGNVQVNTVEGKHPAGNVGPQIHQIDPINKGESVWYVCPQDLIIIGKLFLTGKTDFTKTIALGGSGMANPRYVETLVGTHMSAFENYFSTDNSNNWRLISGSVLSGTQIGSDGFLGYFDNKIARIPEGDKLQFFLTEGWLGAGLKKFSLSRTYFSWLMPNKSYNLNTNLNGEERAFVMTGQYEKVFPFDIFPVQLIKAILANDLDLMEQLGAYEVDAEDFALCEFVCTSKTEVQSIVREGLESLRAEVS